MMKITGYLIILLFINLSLGLSQNLILNSSFSNVINKKDSNTFYQINAKFSNIKNWYLPNYINYNSLKNNSNLGKDFFVKYYTSRDNKLCIRKKIYTNGEQMFENNLGFVQIYINNLHPISLIQQKLNREFSMGNYCLKFKYKYISYNSSRSSKCKLEFSFTDNDLKRYYVNNRLMVPENLICFSLNDSIQETDGNTPWQEKCIRVNLTGNEKYLTIGTLTNIYKYSLDWAQYYIDDVELYKISDSENCTCDTENKDLRDVYQRQFPLNLHVSNDTLVMFMPNGKIAPAIITPPAKFLLNNLISFMQRNPDIKIEFIQHDWFNNLNANPTQCYYYVNYLTFFGINKDRISSKTGLCEDENSIYCGHGAEYIKIGFKFYKE